MSFVTWQYIFLLAGVYLLYWRLPLRGRIWLLLTASYVFYGSWDARFLALILKSTVVDFLCGLAIAGRRVSLARVAGLGSLPVLWLTACAAWPWRTAPVEGWIIAGTALLPLALVVVYRLLWNLGEDGRPRRFLVLSLATNLVLLGFFKYFGFFADSAAILLSAAGWRPSWTLLEIVLPVGISFYTFQSISYVVDVYRGKIQSTDDFPTFATYLAFFPQLVAGPIERSTNLLPQLQRAAPFSGEQAVRGLELILVGFFKKVFVADNCALLANYAFAPDTPLNGWWALLGVLAFNFQIYGDFSGYTDIARGSASLFGIRLTHNFRFPYFARGPSDFWQRWHITLSSWFRDYLYIPLGGNRYGSLATLRNLFLTMLLAGLWHGASWIFVLWGAYHGALLVLYRIVPALKRLEESSEQAALRVPASMAVMFLFTLLGWVLFRCRNLGQLWAWFAALGSWQSAGALAWEGPAAWLLLHVAPLLLLQAAAWRARDEVEALNQPWPVRGLAYALLFLVVASSASNDVDFIYFQF